MFLFRFCCYCISQGFSFMLPKKNQANEMGIIVAKPQPTSRAASVATGSAPSSLLCSSSKCTFTTARRFSRARRDLDGLFALTDVIARSGGTSGLETRAVVLPRSQSQTCAIPFQTFLQNCVTCTRLAGLSLPFSHRDYPIRYESLYKRCH